MGAASFAAMTKKAITKEDLPALKGKREGVRTVGGGTTANTDLEIYNDTVPLQGKLTVHNVIVRGAPGRTVNLEFQNGLIEAGNLVIRKEKNEFEFALFTGEGQMKLEGNYFFVGAKGTMTLNKK